MPRQLTTAYFDNRAEQIRIEEALLKAMPVDVYYHNLIIVLARMLARYVERSLIDDVFTRSMKDKITGA